MVTWKLKSCLRCGGDVFLDRDEYNWFEYCIQCGYARDLQSLGEFNKLPQEVKRSRLRLEQHSGIIKE